MATTSNVTSAKPKVGGAMFRAPLGTALPTDAVSDLAAAFKCLGYIDQDGVKNNISKTSDEERAWGGDVVNVLETDHSDQFSTNLIESLNLDVLKTVFGDDNVSGTLADGIAIKVNAQEKEDAVYVIDMILKGGVLKRIVIPVGRVTEIAEIEYSETASTGYGVTITAQAGADGDTHKEYIKAAASS